MRCPNCGEEYSKKHRFCLLCGTDLTQPSKEEAKAPQPVEPAAPAVPEAASKLARPLTAEDFFGVQVPVRRDILTGKSDHMTALSVEDIDLSRLETDCPLQHEGDAHRRYMKPATAAETDTTNIIQTVRPNLTQMDGADPDTTQTLADFIRVSPTIEMSAPNGIDQFNTAVRAATERIEMSDEIKPLVQLPKRHPVGEELDDIEIPSFIRARRKHTISLEIPSL